MRIVRVRQSCLAALAVAHNSTSKERGARAEPCRGERRPRLGDIVWTLVQTLQHFGVVGRAPPTWRGPGVRAAWWRGARARAR
eukprot:1916133-Pleurochrysis_carterae.AAC.2